MQVFVSFPDVGYPDVAFAAAAESLVSDATQAAADEWGIDAGFLELSLSGSVIPQNSLLMSHGVEGGSQLTASLLRAFGYEWLINFENRAKLARHLSKVGQRHLFLDTPSFATGGCFRFSMRWIPDGIEEISFINPHPSITSAEFMELFLDDEESDEDLEFPISKIDLIGLSSITTIKERYRNCGNFLANCSSLTSLDLTCLSNITKIDSAGFLKKCSSLTSLDLNFNKVTEIRCSFLYRCSALTSLDLTSLNNLTKTGDCFLSSCSSLTSLDLTSLNNVTEIGDCFLSRCSSLTSLDLTSLKNVRKIGQSFLYGCTALTTLDLASLNNVRNIDETDRDFLRCSSLTSVKVGGLSHESKVRRMVHAFIKSQIITE